MMFVFAGSDDVERKWDYGVKHLIYLDLDESAEPRYGSLRSRLNLTMIDLGSQEDLRAHQF